MKSLLLHFFIYYTLFSCALYGDYLDVTILDLPSGIVVLSSENEYRTFKTAKNREITVECKKGFTYYISIYPYIGDSLSRYPLGAIISGESRSYTPSPFLGPITSICNDMNKNSLVINNPKLRQLSKVVTESSDPWQLNRDDVVNILRNKITLSSLSTYKTFVLDDLDYLYGWIPENRLFYKWYSSIQSFENPETGEIFRVNIDEDGTYLGFLKVN